MKAIISLAARMKSSRLPRKVLADVGGEPILEHIVNRVRLSRAEVVISNNEADPEIRELAERLGVRYVGVKGADVMTIHWLAAQATDADFILLAGADDPFLDPAIFDLVLDRLEKGDVAFVKTAGWPLGLGVWGWTRAAMEAGQRLATAPDERQHVVPFWERRPKAYPAAVLHRAGEDLYDRYRLTVDGLSDLDLVRKVYELLTEGLGGRGVPITSEEVISCLETYPDIAAINAEGLHGYAARDAIYDLTPVDTIAAVRAHVATERLAAIGARAEAPDWNDGRAAALLSLDQWLQYRERVG